MVNDYSRFYGITYFLFLIFLVVMSLYERIWVIQKSGRVVYHNNSHRWGLGYMVITIFLIFIGCRGYINTDWLNYSTVFSHLTPGLEIMGEEPGIERGFVVLMKLSKLIDNNYQFFVIVCSLFDCILFIYAFKNEDSIFLCFAFYFLFSGAGCGFRTEFNLMRNIKSILCFCISLKYVNEKCFVKYLLLNLFGSLFHITGLLYLPLYFILNKRFNFKIVIFLFLVGNIFFLLKIKWITSILQLVSSFLPGRIGHIVNVYLASGLYSSSFGLSVGFIERTLTFFIILKFYDNCEMSKIPYYNCLLIYEFIFLYMSEMNILVTRFSLLFIIGYWYVFPNIYFKLNLKWKKVFLCIFILYGAFKLCMSPSPLVVKYDNVLFKHYSYQDRKSILDSFINQYLSQ